MKQEGRKTTFFIFLLIFLIFITPKAYGEKAEKTVIIVLDELDFSMVKSLKDNNTGIGLMNIKTRKPVSEESLFSSIATGRKIGVPENTFEDLKRNKDGSLQIVGDINISTEVDLLGEKLEDEGISYIGNDSSAILAANKSGSIRNGEISIEYNEEWLKEKTNFYLKDSNILIMSYQIDGSREKFKVLNDYIEGYESVNFIVFP